MNSTSSTAWYSLKTNMAETLHNIKFYCTDLYSNTNVSATRYFSVNTSFLATITYPANQRYNTVNMTANVSTSAGANTCLISIDSAANASMTNTSTTAWYYDMTFLSEVTHNLSVWCNSSAGTLVSTATRSFTVDTTAPIVTKISPVGTTGTSVLFNATTNEAAAWCKYNPDLSGNNSMSGSSTVWINTSTLSGSGLHGVEFYCSDLAGNVGTNSTSFLIDAAAPVITINSPENKTYNTATTSFNVTTGENALWCRYSLDGTTNVSLTNSSMTEWNKTVSATNGNHNVVFYCSDVYNNVGVNGTRYFTVDTIAPVITLTTPANNTWRNVTITDFKFYVNDSSNIANCTASSDFVDITNTTAISKTSENSITQSITASREEDNFKWYVNCTDSVGNVGRSVTRVLKLDDIPPMVAIDSPSDGNILTTPTVVVNASVTDGYPDRVMLYRNGTLVSNTTAVSGTNSISQSLSDGSYRFQAFGTDKAGNMQNSLNVSITVDATAPVFTNVTVIDITNESATIVAVTDENTSCRLYSGTNSSSLSDDGTMSLFVWIGGPRHNLTLSSLDAGTLYYYKVNCNDRAGNTKNSTISTFTTLLTETAELNESTTTNMTFNFTENGTSRTKVRLNISLNETVNATVDVGQSDNATHLFSVSGYEGLGVYYTIESDEINGTNTEWVIIKLYYNDADMLSNVEESALRLYWYDGANWVEIPGGVNETENYVWGNTTHFSEYTIAGAETEDNTGGSSSGGSSGGSATIKEIDITADLSNGKITKTVSMSDKVVFNYSGEKHSVVLKGINFTTKMIKLEVASTPTLYDMELGTNIELDLDSNGVNDHSITLDNMTYSYATLTFERVAVTPAAPETAATTTAEQPGATTTPAAQVAGTVTKAATNYGLYLIAFILLVGIAVVVYYVFLRKKVS
jgi:hypothetical protein